MDDNRAGQVVKTDHMCECPVCGRRVGLFVLRRGLYVNRHFRPDSTKFCRGGRFELCNSNGQFHEFSESGESHAN